MKKLIPMFILSLFAATVSAQENADTIYLSLSKGRVAKYAVDEVYSMGFTPVEAINFPVADNSIELVYSPGMIYGGWDSKRTELAKNADELLTRAGIECADTLGRAQITEDEYNEIKLFTENLVEGLATEKAIYDKCFSWIVNNVKYGNKYDDGSVVNNNAYPVFKTKTGVCQGYANLLLVMLHSQGVPVLVTYGFIPEGGHAWNYVNCDGTWYVSDPTNNRYRKMNEYSSYASTFMPTSLDVVLFKEEGLWYNYDQARLNVERIVSDNETVIVPYSVKGVKITSLYPNYVAPDVKELYVGENIESLGDFASGYNDGLKKNAPSLEYMHIDPNNKYFMSQEGVVYSKDGKSIVLIPAAMKRIELLPMEWGKDNSIEYHKNVEEIVFPVGTGSLGSYSISDCPNLKVARIPESVSVSNDAFYNVHKDFKIVRY